MCCAVQGCRKVLAALVPKGAHRSTRGGAGLCELRKLVFSVHLGSSGCDPNPHWPEALDWLIQQHEQNQNTPADSFKVRRGLPWRLRGKESTCQCRRLRTQVRSLTREYSTSLRTPEPVLHDDQACAREPGSCDS